MAEIEGILERHFKSPKGPHRPNVITQRDAIFCFQKKTVQWKEILRDMLTK